ncbi:MAG: Rab family GTPase [Promethearchaeota archaeon]
MVRVDLTFKLLMLGSASTGKTSLSDRFITGIFNPDIKLTVGVEFYVKTLNIGGKMIKLQIWDLGGEERFRFLLPTYSLGSSGALFLYDITRPDTLENISDWTNIVREKNGDIPIVLAGNKIDLVDDRKVSAEQAEEIAKQFDMVDFMELSAKVGTNVELIFELLTKYLIQKALEENESK